MTEHHTYHAKSGALCIAQLQWARQAGLQRQGTQPWDELEAAQLRLLCFADLVAGNSTLQVWQQCSPVIRLAGLEARSQTVVDVPLVLEAVVVCESVDAFCSL